jgi:hypothetical protein
LRTGLESEHLVDDRVEKMAGARKRRLPSEIERLHVGAEEHQAPRHVDEPFKARDVQRGVALPVARLQIAGAPLSVRSPSDKCNEEVTRPANLSGNEHKYSTGDL